MMKMVLLNLIGLFLESLMLTKYGFDIDLEANVQRLTN